MSISCGHETNCSSREQFIPLTSLFEISPQEERPTRALEELFPKYVMKWSPVAHKVNSGSCADVSIRFFKKGLIPQLRGAWLADSPQLFVSSECASGFHPMLFSGWSPVND